ncbi:MAG: hypothetical protein ACYC64_09250 [Armatimonadota bacterium]
MSVWAFLHIVPVSDPEWKPDRSFIDKVAGYLGVRKVDCVTGYSIPNLWGNSLELDKHEIFKRDMVSVSEALDAWEANNPVSAYIMFYGPECDGKLNESIADSVPDQLSDSFRPWDTALAIGPTEVPAPFEEGIVGTFNIDIILEGSGTPIDYEEYLKLVKQNPDMQAFLSFLRDESGREWDVFYNGG